MNVLSCGGVYRRITLAISACALVYLFIFHQDVPREFHFGVEYESDDSVSNRNDSLSHDVRISPVKKSTRSSLPDECTDPKSDRNRIVFLKTHKTASSTIQNILMRYGTKYDKTFALPSTGKTIFKYWKSWSEADYYKLEKAPDMIVHHMRFSKEVEKVFSDANYFSILRNPVIMFESLFNYMKTVAPQFNKAHTLENFLSDPKKYQQLGKSKSMTSFFSRNHMTFEFGYDPNEEDEVKINEMISKIEKRFNFILINEFMAESLIVLRRYLCMDLPDIACFITNARKSSSKLSHKIQKDLENWNRADFMLYQHFNSTLWNKIEEIGISKVQSEVKELQELVSNLTDKCVAGYFENKDLPPEFQVYKQPGVKVLGIKLTPEGEKDDLCYSMARPEFPWTELIMKRQGQSVKTLKAFSKT